MNIQAAKSNEYAGQLCDLMTSVLSPIERSLSHSATLIEVYDVPEPYIANVQAWLNGYLNLTPVASSLSIPADNITESVITCDGLASFRITVWFNGKILTDWNDALIADGTAEFSTNLPGMYVFGVRDGFNTGFVKIIVTEV